MTYSGIFDEINPKEVKKLKDEINKLKDEINKLKKIIDALEINMNLKDFEIQKLKERLKNG